LIFISSLFIGCIVRRVHKDGESRAISYILRQLIEDWTNSPPI
jgi:hypothetical protein